MLKLWFTEIFKFRLLARSLSDKTTIDLFFDSDLVDAEGILLLKFILFVEIEFYKILALYGDFEDEFYKKLRLCPVADDPRYAIFSLSE